MSAKHKTTCKVSFEVQSGHGCVPVMRGEHKSRVYTKPGAHCTIKPAFKKQIKGR